MFGEKRNLRISISRARNDHWSPGAKNFHRVSRKASVKAIKKKKKPQMHQHHRKLLLHFAKKIRWLDNPRFQKNSFVRHTFGSAKHWFSDDNVSLMDCPRNLLTLILLNTIGLLWKINYSYMLMLRKVFICSARRYAMGGYKYRVPL